MPYTERVPEDKRDKFIKTLAKKYIEASPRDPAGKVHVDMVRLDLKIMDFNVFALRNLAQKLVAMIADNWKLEGVSGILWLPHKVESVLSDAVVVVCKAFHFSFLRAFFCGANATQDGALSAPATPRTHLYSRELEKDYGGIGCPWAEAQGIL